MVEEFCNLFLYGFDVVIEVVGVYYVLVSEENKFLYI